MIKKMPQYQKELSLVSENVIATILRYLFGFSVVDFKQVLLGCISDDI